MRVFSLVLVILFTISSNNAHSQQCELLYEKAKESLENFYLEEGSAALSADNVQALTIQLKACPSVNLTLRVDLIRAYIDYSNNLDFENSFSVIFNNWEKFLEGQNYQLTSLEEVEGFTEYINAIRFAFKNMTISQKNSKEGLALLSKQAGLVEKVIKGDSKFSWVLYNQYLNSLINQLSFFEKSGRIRCLCSTVEKIENEILKKKYFSEKQIADTNKPLGAIKSKYCS
ncbi:hypothetical protein ACWXWU_11100 [Shewanella sp. A14]